MVELTPYDWEKLIRPGSRVFVGSGAGCPHALMRSLVAAAPQLKDVELVHVHTAGPTPWLDPALADTFVVNTFVHGPTLGDAVREGRADYTPCFLSEIPGLFLDGVLPLDAALVQVTPPDVHGYCSLGVSVDVVSAACRAARVVIAQLNPRMPRTHGQSFIHVDRIDAFLPYDEPLVAVPPVGGTPEMETIGRYVAQLIEDGSTLRVGIGALPDAVLAALAGHRDLGVHSELLGDGYLPLLRSGAINNRRKSLHTGKTITSFCLGTQELYDYVHDNPHVEFHPTEYVNNPLVIARNDRMVSVTAALELDLSGQVVADPLGHGFHSGLGGQVDFIRGATMSRGGLPIIALPSTSADGRTSRIVPHLREGAGVVTSRGDVHYIVTEYGVATLRGRSLRERALELIQVAHPKYRDDLLREAVATGLVPAYQRSSPRPVGDLGDLESQRLTLADGRYLLRPLHPSDIRRLQEFFYSHTLETIQMRYGYAVTRMPRERAYDLVNVDQSRDLALAIFETQGPREMIHAVGRYYLDPDGKSAEVAFVVRETKRRCGMASTLMDALLAVARRRGLASVWGRVRKDNLPMLALFRRYGATSTRAEDAEAGDYDVRIDLTAKESATTAPRPRISRAKRPGSASSRAGKRRPPR
ncbi:MAG: GNAT family N-acetyltransferase [Opitutaceae bacterium]|nr:GNAT family N-acetyltransferase [Opitutaceae bacterium]